MNLTIEQEQVEDEDMERVNFDDKMNINCKGSGSDSGSGKAEAAIDIDVVEEEASSISLNHLPDEILLLIFNRLCDLKCLCSCSLVSPRFSSLIFHVHSVSFSVPTRLPQLPPITTQNLSKKFLSFFANGIVAKFRQILGPKPVPPMISSFYGDSFRSAIYFLSKFKAIRSLHIVLPSSPHKDKSSINANGSNSLFQWTARFGPTIDTFIFLSHTSIRRAESEFEEEQGEEESRLTNELLKHRVHLAFQCLKDAIVRHRMLLFFVEEHPILQNITITDSKKQGTLFLRDRKLVEMRNWINSASTEVKLELKRIEVPVNAKQWHVPVLKLPTSRQVMEGAMLVLMEMNGGGTGDVAALVDVFEQGEEEEKATFTEAVVEMMVNHKSRINILL